jgi:hypothetical protein
VLRLYASYGASCSSPVSRVGPWFGAWTGGSGTTGTSSPHEANYGKEEGGFLLLFLLPLLTLMGLCVAGTVRVAWQTQNRVAMQSRLDICSLGLLQERERAYQSVARGNRTLDLSATGIYALRAGRILSGPIGALVGTLGEQGLLRLNHATALWQETTLAISQARELRWFRCAPSSFSRGFAACAAGSTSRGSLVREPSLFPDVKGALVARSPGRALAHFTCRGGRLVTKRVLHGDPKLRSLEMSDYYAQ